MKYYPMLITFFLFASQSSKGQVLTPDFRYYTSCPTWYSQVDVCTGWRQPTGGTSDYFNACDAVGGVGVPQNVIGYQTSFINAYVGLYTYVGGTEGKEYIATDIQPLSIGQTYTMTISVSLADSCNIANDGFGVFFTTYPVNLQSLSTTLLVKPQVDYSSYGVIKDKVNWVPLTKTFVADSAYSHITVGCFKPYGTMLMDSLYDGSQFRSFSSAYYYIGQIGEPDPTRHSDTDYFTPPDTNGLVSTYTSKYVFPNAFSPNNNGRNEVFRIIGSNPGILRGYTFSVYNRWGQRVFFTNDPYSGWNGMYNNVPQDIGTYFYICAFTFFGEYKVLKGDVTLLR